MERPAEGHALLELRSIVKRFPGVVALSGVSFTCAAGEVHALVGENGAGKSTLIKLLAGAHEPDEGEIAVGGERFERVTPEEAQRLGIAVIHQEFNLLPDLSVAENLAVGREPRTRLGLVDVKAMRRRAEELLGRLGVRLDVGAPVATLTVAQQQLVEIAKALSVDARLVVMDEPSAVIAGEELEQLFAVVEALRDRGVGVIYISHRLGEVFRLADRVTVLRDGAVGTTRPASDVTRDELVRLMVGRSLEEEFPMPSAEPGEVVLEVRDLEVDETLHGVSFALRAGEVLGVAGLVGSGRTTLGLALYGARRASGGEVVVDGRSGLPRSPRQAIGRGVVLVPEDRKTQGVVLDESVRFNLSLPVLGRLRRSCLVDRRAEAELAERTVRDLAIRPPLPDRTVRFLSGGNQQKVALGKWLSIDPKVLILDEPTRGVDVGGKLEIYKQIRELTARGMAVLMISSELPEILGMSDRVLVLCEGRAAGILERGEATEESVMRLATAHAEAA
jgi:ABC-type sugar transport system ATPase subunit